MKPCFLFLVLLTLAFSGCTTRTTKTYEDGTTAPVIIISHKEQMRSRDARYKNEKYSANLYSYKQAYVLAYLEAQEQGAFAPDKPRLPLFEAGSSLMAVNSLGIALDAVGSSWASSLFSPGFLAGGIVLGMLNPPSEEKRFVQYANMEWKEITSSSIQYLALAPLENQEDATIDRKNEAWFERASQMLNKAQVVCELDPKKAETVHQGYSRTVVKKCALIDGDRLYSVLVESSVAAEKSNYTQKFGPVVVSRMWLFFGAGKDEQVAQVAAKLKPFIEEDWISLYPAIDASGQRRMFVEKGDDVAVFDLPPQPFKKTDESKEGKTGEGE